MEVSEQIDRADVAALRIVHYPDPRLRHMCTPLDAMDDKIRQIVERMFELMFAARGVGLAAPQIGINARIFIASPSFEPSDCRVYVNPKILTVDGTQDGEEGCLSFPGISAKIKRYNFATIRAMNLQGEIFEETGEELTARIFQHEIDHLDGRLLVDRMGSIARLSNRRALKDLEEQIAK